MIYPIRTIVAGVSELDGPDLVLTASVELAKRTGATLHVVHTFELPQFAWDAYAGMGVGDAEMLWGVTERIGQALEARVRREAGGRDVRCHAIVGPPAVSIQQLAKEKMADVIMVGATRHGGLARRVLGTTAQRVLRGASAPVLVVRDRLPERLHRVLLTTDLTVFSAGIHEVGLDVLEALYAGRPPALKSLFVLGFGDELPLSLRGDLLEQTARSELDEFLSERRARGGSIAGTVRVGEPNVEIVAEASEWPADLLILGTHGRRGSRRWLLGSVAEAVVREVPVSVLVIPAGVEAKRRLPVLRTRRSNALVQTAGRAMPSIQA